MGVALVLASVLCIQAPAAAPSETWDALAAEYEHAFVAFYSARTGDQDRTSRPPPSASPEFRARFEALAADGEGRAVLWLLLNPNGPADQRRAELATLFERVRAASDEAWVETAMLALAGERANLDRAALASWLESQQGAPKPASLRSAALLASAMLVEDAARAGDLRVAAALLRWKEQELAAGESPDAERIADLATALTDGVEEAQDAWFEGGFREADDGTYYPMADCPPDPRTIWRPAIEAVAARGGTAARVWVLANTWPQDEATSALVREQLDAIAREGIDEQSLISLSYRIGSWVRALGVEFVEPRVRRLAENASDTAQAKLLFSFAEGMCKSAEDDAQRERGFALLREVKQRWPDSEAGKRVEGKLFRHTKLQVGMPIPDFEAVDVDGKAFKLSDSLGKVTVVDFWGFW